MAEVHHMNGKAKLIPVVTLALVSGVAFTAGYRLNAQSTGTAPGLKITDLGRASSRTYRVNMVKGDEIMSGLVTFAAKNHIKNAHFTGLGAIDKGVLRWSDPVNKGSKTTQINEEAEVVSLVGSIATDKDGKPTVHAHTVVALSDGTTRGGHLMNAQVSIIAEVFVTEEEGAESPASR
jgi:predicted DNA-binding protein with PD1-like motif